MQVHYILIPLIAIAVVMAGSLITRSGIPWFRTLRIPSWMPPAKIITGVWTILFVLTSVSAVLAWDASPSPGVTNYTIYTGRTSAVYAVHFSAGTNLAFNYPPPRLTNVVVTVSGLGTNWSGTNPAGMRLWQGTNLTISKRYQ